MFGRPNPGVFEAALRCQNTAGKRPVPAKLLSRTRLRNKDLLVSGALCPRKGCAPSWIALHFWLTTTKISFPIYRRPGLKAVNISIGHGTSHYAVSTLLLRISPSSILNRSAAQSLFAFRSCLYNTSRSLSFFSMIAKLSSGFTATLSCSFCPSQ